jgi:hypothetical protein
MKRETTIKDALSVWREQACPLAQTEEHLQTSELYEFLVRAPSGRSKSAILKHLCCCSECSRQLKEMLAAIEEAEVWDYSLPKAASSQEIQWSGEIATAGGKYSIVIRRSLSDQKRGVITLQVGEPHRDLLEGRSVLVKDGQGRVLLKGKVIDGEVSQEVVDLDGIVPRFFVEPVESQKR